MVIADTSAWIEYFRDGIPKVVQTLDYCLEYDLAGIGDLIYCEVIQGIKAKKEREKVTSLFQSLPKFDMVGFNIAERSADNYRLLRSKGISVRKTIDVLIGTFCSENKFKLIHNDRDFTIMSKHIRLEVYKL